MITPSFLSSPSFRGVLAAALLAPGLCVAQNAVLTNAHVPLFVEADIDRTIAVRVRNLATTPLITFRVDWRWNNGPVQQGFSQTTTGISGNQFWPYEHPVPFNVPQGSGLLKVWVVGAGETDPSNDTLTFQVTALDQWHPKTVLLDQWTGTWCPQCPPANTVGNALDNDPRVVVAKHHAVDQFSSDASTAYFGAYNVTFTPAGVVDQGEYGGYAPNAASNQWTSEVDLRKQGVSPVEIALDTDYDALTRVLTVHLGATYTVALPGEHALNAFILEDDLAAPQANAPANYVHQQVVRDVLAGPTGDGGVVPSPPVPGTTYHVTWNYLLPEDRVAENIRVAAFVTHRDERGAYTLNARSSAPLAVGMEEGHDGLDVRLYPNPSTDHLWMEWDRRAGPAHVRILAVDGRVAWGPVTFHASGAVPLEGYSNLAPGVYVVELMQGSMRTERRVVKP